MEHIINLTNHWAGFSALIIFIVAYGFVMAEEFTHLRKSKPVVLAAGLIWGIVAFARIVDVNLKKSSLNPGFSLI